MVFSLAFFAYYPFIQAVLKKFLFTGFFIWKAFEKFEDIHKLLFPQSKVNSLSPYGKVVKFRIVIINN